MIRRTARRALLFGAGILHSAACASRPHASSGALSTAGTAGDVAQLSGTYAGSWQTYALDRSGRIAAQAAWVDTMFARDPVEEPGRTYVITTDNMTFSGGRIPPMRVTGREGYLRNPDGSWGEYFVESMGQTTQMRRIATDTWVAVSSATPRELVALGDDASARHVLVKVVSTENGVETHRISRVTTVHWRDASGALRAAQYVSLQGEHRRIAR